MLNSKKLLQMVRKWRKVAALGKKRILSVNADTAGYTNPIASRGHLYVYTTDQKRFMVPLKYLSSSIFKELLKMSEEEFGLPSDGPIMLPCDATCMEFIISLIERESSEELERSVIGSVHHSRRSILYGF